MPDLSQITIMHCVHRLLLYVGGTGTLVAHYTALRAIIIGNHFREVLHCNLTSPIESQLAIDRLINLASVCDYA